MPRLKPQGNSGASNTAEVETGPGQHSSKDGDGWSLESDAATTSVVELMQVCLDCRTGSGPGGNSPKAERRSPRGSRPEKSDERADWEGQSTLSGPLHLLAEYL